MRERSATVLQKIAKFLIFAGVIASFFFIGWRIITKGEYQRSELAQCEAMATSAALAACDALDDAAMADYIRKEGESEFVIDHMKMPGHNVVSLKIAPSGDGFSVTARAETNWNSRTPQWAEVSAQKTKNGVLFAKESADAKALRHIDYDKFSAGTRLTFTFPYERECPVSFDVYAAKIDGLWKKPLTVLRIAD